jgi:hypothetical protein
MRLADCREIKFVFRIMWVNEVVGNLMRQREIPREMAIQPHRESDKHREHVPGDHGLAEIASLDIAVV